MSNYIISKEHGTAVYGVGAIRGCAAAHLIASGQPFGRTILEADACFTGFPLLSIRSDYSDCDILYMGLSLYKLKHRIVNNDITRLEYCLGTHAYCIYTERGRQMMREACVEAISKNKHLDVCLAERMNQYNVYAYRQPRYVQGPETNRYYSLTNISV